MKKRKTQKEFEKELELILPNVQVLGKYINTNTKIHCRCLVHDCEFDALPVNMLHGHNGCKKCGGEKQSKTQTKSHKQFALDLKEVNPNIEVIGEYINMNTKIRVKCLTDGYIWDADPRKLMRGCQCSVCSNRTVMVGVNDIATTRPDLVKYFKEKEDAFRYTSGSEKYVDIICPECGYEDNIRISNLSRFGFSCNGCYEKKYGHKRVPYGYWNENTMQQYLDENCHGYKLLDIQMPSDDRCKYLKAFIKCPNEDHPPYWSYWKNITSGYTCLLCYMEDSMSKGERSTENILKQYDIDYEPQKRFDDCRDSYTLPFDFYLPDYNLVIEIMGEQHEHPVELFGGQEGFEKRVVHDKIKRDYLKQNDINILDIWYYEFDKMEELILNKIKSISSTHN